MNLPDIPLCSQHHGQGPFSSTAKTLGTPSNLPAMESFVSYVLCKISLIPKLFATVGICIRYFVCFSITVFTAGFKVKCVVVYAV